jgi:hypothetical protein
VAPIFNSSMIIYNELWDGGNFVKAIIIIKEKLPSIMLTNASIWPLAQYINFKYVPLKLRVLYINLVGVVWITILSLLISK